MLDALTALVLSAFLLVVSVKIILLAIRELTDRAPNRRMLKRIEETIAYTEGVRNFHAFRAREIGGRVEMDIHVLVDPDLTVREGHDIATDVKKAVMETDPTIVEVIVHIEPAKI
jgi:cation diffusion facilitator family transporter